MYQNDSDGTNSTNNDKSIFHIPYCDDPIVEQGLYAQAFANIKKRYQKDESERCIFRGCSDFYNFLKNAYYVLEDQVDYIKFCNELGLDSEAQSRYKMKEFLDECHRKLSELRRTQDISLIDKTDMRKQKHNKGIKRVSFNLFANSTRYFVHEHLNLHHGNYTKLDKKEGQVPTESDIWLLPVQLKQKTEFKTNSQEIKNKRNILKIPSGQFLSTENLITDMTQNKTIELTLINLNKKNEFYDIPRVRHQPDIIHHSSTNHGPMDSNVPNQNSISHDGLKYNNTNYDSVGRCHNNQNTPSSKNGSPHLPHTTDDKNICLSSSFRNIAQNSPNSFQTRNLLKSDTQNKNNIRTDIINKSITGNKKLLKNILLFFN